MRTKVVVSRKWTNPEITAFLTGTEVGAEMSLNDFLDALTEEVGNPTLLMTKAALRQKLEQASIAIQHELRNATSRVV